jgi:hypothetical protein
MALIPEDRVRIADQYGMLHAPHGPEEMAQIYSAMDVLVNPSFGEGFGIPIIEAQACGVPVIVNDFTAMPELCGAGWRVKHQPYWSGLGSWQAIPNVDDIAAALEECYSAPAQQRDKLSKMARRHAMRYNLPRVAKQYMLPALREAERRLEARSSPVIAVPDVRPWTVSVVTPWRDHPELGEKYQEAIKAAKPDQLLIIDDASEVPVHGAAFRFDEPAGFVRACNKGLELATSDVVVLLNNDVEVIESSWLDRIIALCEPGTLVGELRDGPHAWVDGEAVPYIDGWCVAGMRADLEQLGGLDTEFVEPAYYTDNDLSVRAVASGMRLVGTIVGLRHLVNVTTNDDPAARERASATNRRLYQQRVRALRPVAA